MNYFHRYLALGADVRESDFAVIAGGYAEVPPHTPYPPLSHPVDHAFQWREGRTLREYQLIYITRGRGVFESRSGGVQQLQAGSIFMLFPGEWHRYSPDPETGWEEYWVAFQGKAVPQQLANCPLSLTTPIVFIGLHEPLREEYLRMSIEMRREAIGYQQILAARANLLLTLASVAVQRHNFAGTQAEQMIEQAKVMLREQLSQPVNVEELASRLEVGYSWFRRTFRHYTGLSPAQYHLQLRINRACELLGATTLPIATIGQNLGFESAYYFSRIFKAKMGHTPRDYRNLIQTPLTVPKSDRYKGLD